ncbi:hypothetical protein K6Q96_19680 [Grimontia kaedaensis]|uniref:Phage holin family protein n=1 Tax=Grimontia kaedaensis TaxID=2872157 RepID=A0ABY4X2K6_9GAMM|nr:hypothetical protein [Grimontia kaedaensis]USH05425.1 hypothetical protein K6Q96_19680 [Grimontia kaedaensis]
MNRRVVINGKEISNPVAILALQAGALIVAALVIAFVFFVILPLVGLFIGSIFIAAITFLVVIAVAVIIGIFSSVISAYLAELFGGNRR